MSTTRTAILLAGMTALFLAIGYLLGGQSGMVIALVFAAATNAFAYWNSDKMVLRMYGAQEVDARTAPEFHGLVQQLSRRAGLPTPKAYIIDEAQPNAFATGRDPEHAAVAATTGLLHMLNHQELAGVIAHEIAHIKNRDTLIMTVSATLAGAISGVANIFMFTSMFGGSRDGEHGPNPIVGMLIMVLGPLAAMLVQMAISRTREYGADRAGAEFCGHPLWLASALQKLEAGAQRIASPVADSHPATAHMFIVNPLHGGAVAGLFRTHPATEDRVRALRELAVRSGQSGPWG